MSGQPIDIRPDHEALVRDILLARLPKGVRVWAFGSRAKWLAKPYSDLDLALEAAEPLPDDLVSDLKDDFTESDLPWKVDVLDLNAIAPSFRKLIDKDKVGFSLKGKWRKLNFLDAPIEIIDGDRGVNYPKQIDFTSKEYCLFLNAGNVSPSGFNFSDCAFINEERDNLLRKGKLERFDSVLTTRGTVGNVAFFDNSVQFDHIRINSGMIIFRPDQSAIVPRFLYLFLRSDLFKNQVSALTTGSAQPQLPIRDIRRIHMPILSLPEQRAIASVLGSLDDKIELNRRMNETLEAMARAIFKDWFVDFGPTRAKMEGQEPYLAPEIWEMFPGTLGGDGLPEGWEEKPLLEFFSIIGGGTPKTKFSEYWDGDIPWFSVVDAPQDRNVFVFNTEKSITQRGLDESSTRLIREGITIISARGTVGKLAMASQNMTFNQSCYGLQGINDVGDCFTFLAAQHMVFQLQSMAHGSVFSTITRETFDAISLVMPLRNVLREFENISSSIFAKIKANGENTHTLAQTRDLLLPKLMSGAIRVREAEGIVEAAG